jgi:predicted amidohydrolase
MRLALCQLTGAPYEASANRAASFEAAEDALRNGAELVLLPELIVPGYGADPDRVRELAERIDGPTVTGWSRLAADYGGLVAGGFCERADGGIFNTAVLVDGSGVLAHYRKLHLFAAEKHAFAPGDLGLGVVDTALGRIGLCVCYDLRFVETVRILALRGAELVLVPTAWVAGFDRERWDADGLALQAHGALLQANLSQVFIACASHAGTRGGTEFLGSSIVADPLGRRACGPLPRDRDETAIVELDLADRAGVHEHVTRACGAVEPERVDARRELVEDRCERRAVSRPALQHVLVSSCEIVRMRADLDLPAVQRRIGVDDQCPQLAADLEDDGLGVRACGVELVHRQLAGTS